MSTQPSIYAPTRARVYVPKSPPTTSRFEYPATLVGSSKHFNIYHDPVLGPGGQQIANAVLASCETDYNTLSGYFGGLTTPNINVILVPRLGGAYHRGCTATDLYCDAETVPDVNVAFTQMLVVAELVEVFAASQGAAWNCQASTGEGLSRVLAVDMYPAGLGGYASAHKWLDYPGRPDFVTVTESTDQNEVSNGCSVLFLNYMHHELQHGWSNIVQAGEATLAETYRKLTGQADALTPFKSLLQTKYPEGTPCGLTTDNPFPIGAPAPSP